MRSSLRGNRYYDPPLPTTAPPLVAPRPHTPSTLAYVLASIAMALSLAAVIYVHHATMLASLPP
jgi:hypothetical protein